MQFHHFPVWDLHRINFTSFRSVLARIQINCCKDKKNKICIQIIFLFCIIVLFVSSYISIVHCSRQISVIMAKFYIGLINSPFKSGLRHCLFTFNSSCLRFWSNSKNSRQVQTSVFSLSFHIVLCIHAQKLYIHITKYL